MTTTQSLYLEDVDIGDEIPAQVRTVDRDDVLAFLEAWHGKQEPGGFSGRFTDPEHAKKEGLPGPIVPGIMSMALISRTLTDWAPTVDLKTIDVIFRQVVPQGTQIRIYGVVTDKDEQAGRVEADIYLEPLGGQPFIRGKADLSLPARGE